MQSQRIRNMKLAALAVSNETLHQYSCYSRWLGQRLKLQSHSNISIYNTYRLEIAIRVDMPADIMGSTLALYLLSDRTLSLIYFNRIINIIYSYKGLNLHRRSIVKNHPTEYS